MIAATSDTSSWPNCGTATKNHTPRPTSAEVAARRMTTDSSVPKASQSATYRIVRASQTISRMASPSVGAIPSRRSPKPAMTASAHDQRDGDDRQAGRELAVDDVVAMDRLREQAREGALVALAVDGVEREPDAEQRRGDRDEQVDAEERRRPRATA